MEANRVFKKNPDMVTKVFDKETVLLPIYKSSDDINCFYILSKAASRMWELIDGRNSVSEIKKLMLEEFDATPKEADSQIEKFLKELREIEVVV